MVVISAFYASLLALVFIALSRQTISARRSAKVYLGDGGNEQLLQNIRAHGNFSEYVPLALLLIVLAEIQGAPALLIHTLGTLLVLARLTHAFGLSKRLHDLKYRVIGVVGTFITIITSAVTNLVLCAGNLSLPL